MGNFELLQLLNKGGLLVWPILLCSLAGMTIFIGRLLLYRRILKREESFDEVLDLIFQGELDAARDSLASHQMQSSAARLIMFEALSVIDPDRETIEMVLTHGVEREMSLLSRHLNTLAVLGSSAPLLGLLGTVVGMIKAFIVVEEMGGGVNAAVLAGGIWEAMLTTAFGLLVAIPLLFFHNHLEGKLHNIQSELEEVIVTFMKVWSKGHNHSL